MSWLDPEEQRRANLRRSLIDRARFIAAHAALRTILGDALGIAPPEVVFTAGEYRKPGLAPHLNAGGWQFNMAHSGNRAIIALTRHRRIGVDIEAVTRTYDDLCEITRTFSAAEREQLAAVPPAEAAIAFYRCWTRKEALLKAVGTGILGKMDAFTVSISPGPANLLHTDPSFGRAEDWTLVPLDSEYESDRYAAALAIEGTEVSIRSSTLHISK